MREIFMSYCRHTFKEIRETLAKSGFIENVYPIYAIGFKLP